MRNIPQLRQSKRSLTWKNRMPSQKSSSSSSLGGLIRTSVVVVVAGGVPTPMAGVGVEAAVDTRVAGTRMGVDTRVELVDIRAVVEGTRMAGVAAVVVGTTTTTTKGTTSQGTSTTGAGVAGLPREAGKPTLRGSRQTPSCVILLGVKGHEREKSLGAILLL